MASLLLGPPTDENGNVKKIPKVAVYVAGAAFAVTTGLTLLVLPFVKQAAKMTNQTQFLSNRHLARPVARAIQAPTSSSLDTSSAPKAITSPIIEQTQEIQREKRFNDDEERSLYGALEGEHEYVSPWLGAQALGLATALVMGSAALGMWGVAKAMGVKNMEEFTSKMRETLLIKMPALAEALTEPPVDTLPVDHTNPAALAEDEAGDDGITWSSVWNDIANSREDDTHRPS